MEGGSIAFDKVLAINSHSRIPNLTHVYGFDSMLKVLCVLLGQFNNSLNLIRPMNNDQVVECAEALLFTSEEDKLAIEDFVVFFKGAKEGKYGRILDRLDQQTIFEMLEKYRQERHESLLRIKDEMSSQNKALPVNDRIADMFESEKDKMKSANIEYLRNKAQ